MTEDTEYDSESETAAETPAADNADYTAADTDWADSAAPVGCP